MWNSRDREKHWTQKEWPIHETLDAVTPNIVHDPIVSREKVVFPPLHIKLGLIKQFMKALDSDGECFQHIVSAFPKLLFDKIKAGVLMDLRFVPLYVMKNLSTIKRQGEGGMAIFCSSYTKFSW